LSVLRLDGNLLISFPIWELSSNSLLQRLTLADNWWQCDCDFVRNFRMFVDGNMDVIEDATRITCTSSELDDPSHLRQCAGILGNQLGGSAGNGGAGGGGGLRLNGPLIVGGTPVFLAVALAVLAVCLAVAAAVFCRMRSGLLIWLHHKHGIRFCGHERSQRDDDDPPPEFLFDALILHSAKDESVVKDEVAKHLELRGFQLCLLHRDLTGIYTSEAFKSALAASKRQIVFYSAAFFANASSSSGNGGETSEWDYVRELDLHDPIVVLIDDVEDIPVDAGRLKRRARGRGLRWNGSDSFWMSLKYHLPDPSKTPVKEGGAELDVSGVWTFTPMDGTASTNVAGSPDVSSQATPSRTRHLRTDSRTSVVRTGAGSGASGASTASAASLANEKMSSGPGFPAPPVKKQPHQCSTHYLAGAPPPPAATSTPDFVHHRSLSNEYYQFPLGPVGTDRANHTRSCGTNAADGHHLHQRSSSAIVQSKRPFSHLFMPVSSLEEVPPTPPPKVNKQDSFYNFPRLDEPPQTPQLPPLESIYSSPPPQNSFLSRLLVSSAYQAAEGQLCLAAPSQVPPPLDPSELLLRPPPVGQDDPPAAGCANHWRVGQGQRGGRAPPVVRAAHCRSASLLSEANGANSAANAGHTRSSSSSTANPVQGLGLAAAQPPPRRSASSVTRATSMLVAPAEAPRRQPRPLYWTPQHAPPPKSAYRSVTNLRAPSDEATCLPMLQLHQPPGVSGRSTKHRSSAAAAVAHARSKSTPFEGFVL
jgi:hypothetical protein